MTGSMSSRRAGPALPLSGIRVVDVTHALAGPFCTMMLGDQGAEVIKIEQPGLGDDSRQQSNPRIGNENSAFLGINRNKKSITIDLRKPKGQEIARLLTRKADVFMENFRPGKAEELGLGYKTLRADNPRLIYCSLSGWGADGPYAHRAGYATIAEAAGGLMSVTGEPGRPPVKIGVSIVDNIAGLFAKDAITAAILARERTGIGQKVETSLLESVVAVLNMGASAYLIGGKVAQRWGSQHEYNHPWKAFKTRDGYLMLCSSSEGQWKKICEAIGRRDLIGDERFRTMELRARHRDELYQILDAIMLERATDGWVKLADEAGAAASRINSIDEVFSDPQVLHRQMVITVEHPIEGEIRLVGFPQKFSETPCEVRLPPPVLGQHTEEILEEELGMSEQEIQRLRAEEII